MLIHSTNSIGCHTYSTFRTSRSDRFFRIFPNYSFSYKFQSMILSFINIYWTTWGSMLLCGDSRYTPQWRFWKGFQSITAAFYGACDIHRTWQSLPKAFTEITPEAAAKAAFWWIGQSNMKSKAAGSLAALVRI